MTNENTPPIFGPSFVIEPADHKPRSGKSFWMAAMDVTTLAGKASVAETIIDNCTTTIPVKHDVDGMEACRERKRKRIKESIVAQRSAKT